jgi:hypothetical protein
VSVEWAQEPTKVADLPDASLWEAAAFGTHYRGLAVLLPVSAERLFGLGAATLVAVEPAGGKKNLVPARMWATFAAGQSTLHQNYVEEKFAVQGEDAVALTCLVAAMLDRTAALTPEEPVGALSQPEEDTRPCPACGATLRESDTHWSLYPSPMGGYVCPRAASEVFVE